MEASSLTTPTLIKCNCALINAEERLPNTGNRPSTPLEQFSQKILPIKSKSHTVTCTKLHSIEDAIGKIWLGLLFLCWHMYKFE